jgi:hypothetical protein
MSKQVTHFVIEFLYVDNDQLYQSDVLLTDKQYERINKFLDALREAEYIKPEGGGGFMIYPFVQPEPVSFKALKEHWTDSEGLITTGKLYKVKF